MWQGATSWCRLLALATFIGAVTLFALLCDTLNAWIVWLTAFLGLRSPGWLGILTVLGGAPLAAVAVAHVAGRFRSAWIAWPVEITTLLVGAYALPQLARVALVVFLSVTLGPLSPAPNLVWRVWSAVEVLGHPGCEALSVVGLVAVLAASFLALRFQGGRLGTRGAILLIEGTAGLALLGTSFRLPALLAIAAAIGVDATTTPAPRAARRWITGRWSHYWLLPHST